LPAPADAPDGDAMTLQSAAAKNKRGDTIRLADLTGSSSSAA